jgi:hypothetical protein
MNTTDGYRAGEDTDVRRQRYENATDNLEDLAAELTAAAYRIALRRSASALWLDLELDLWHAMAQTVEKWQQYSQPHVR